MKYSTRLSDAVHIASFIRLNPTQDLSSGAIAHSIRTNPSYVRRLMSALKRAGLLHGTRGQAAPPCPGSHRPSRCRTSAKRRRGTSPCSTRTPAPTRSAARVSTSDWH